ncbi:hypothetical protein B0H17DRAFT_1149280 [Mycena rosella]|uniref:Uncharacterized protein n=1 Tax=Mycena rosella TaxID=1033263 RepID=A0AAD7C393_MYCRO|nr:hypothetical protein B0H17DRAFT_1149280 [Mycena rosella]
MSEFPPPPLKYEHDPSEVTNQYLLAQFPDATVVMSHDDDWHDILRVCSDPQHNEPSTVQSTVDLLQQICDRFMVIEEDGKLDLSNLTGAKISDTRNILGNIDTEAVPNITITDLCNQSADSNDVLAYLQEQGFETARGLFMTSEVELSGAGLRMGQVAELKRALRELIYSSSPELSLQSAGALLTSDSPPDEWVAKYDPTVKFRLPQSGKASNLHALGFTG